MVDSSALLGAQALLWLVLIAIVCVVIALLGQVRYFYRRIAPLGALAPTMSAVNHLEAIELETVSGDLISIGGMNSNGKSQLLLFVSGSCPISRKMISIAVDFTRREKLELLFCGDDALDAQKSAISMLGIPEQAFVNEGMIGQRLGVDRVPFAVLLGADGHVVARGLVNSLEHLESLLGVQETGHASLQSFMTANPGALAS